MNSMNPLAFLQVTVTPPGDRGFFSDLQEDIYKND